MKAIKFLLGLGLVIASSSVFSQGLDGIVVEKFYQPTSADLTLANANEFPNAAQLTLGSVTYRVYANLAPGYKLNAVYGDAAHPSNFTTTTEFYNHSEGATLLTSPPSENAYRANARALDSYLTIGSVAADLAGVIEAEDDNGAIVNSDGILQNNPGGACYGLPIFGTGAKDGLVPSTLTDIAQVGMNATLLGALGSIGGSNVTFNDGSYYTQTGVVGPTASTTNMVLIGQFTTDGEFSFAINLQVAPVAGGASTYYVSSNPTGTEQTLASLTLAPNAAPTVSVAGTIVSSGASAGANIINGTAMKFTATAADNVSVTDVKFYDGATLLSTDASSPYEHLYTAVQGSHSITAVATDGQCVATTSAPYAFTSAANVAPSVVLTVAGSTTTVVGNTRTFTAAVTDQEGFPLSSAGVQFYKDDVAISGAVDTEAPYIYNYTVLSGGFSITAKIADHLGEVGTSNSISITGLANTPPTISLVSNPLANSGISSYVSQGVVPQGQSLTQVVVTATTNDANDGNGMTAPLVWYLDNAVVTTGVSGNVFTWASTAGNHTIKAEVTDNNGASVMSSVISYVIDDKLALPYEVKTVTQDCNAASFCVPVAVAANYIANDIKGYDIVMTYSTDDVIPATTTTGSGSTAVTTVNITPYSTLLSGSGAGFGQPSPSWIDVTAAIQSAGVLNISLSLNANAPANAEWNGSGANLFCVEFLRQAPASAVVGFQPFDESTVGINFLQESRITGVVTKEVKSGKMVSTTEQNYVAKVQNWLDNSAISYDATSPNDFLITNIQGVLADGTYTSSFITPDNTPVAPVVPNVAGQFTHVLNTMYDADGSGTASTSVRTAVPNIAIQRDIANSANAIYSVFNIINSSDAVIAKTLLINGFAPADAPSVYQMIAMDVNRDGVISAGDVTQMQQRTVGILLEFMQAWNYNADGTPVVGAGPSKDFLFIDPASLTNDPAYSKSTTWPLNNNVGYSKSKVPVVPFYLPVNISNYNALDLSCPVVGTANYKGIMFGDVNGSYATYANNGFVKANDGDYILVDLSNAIVEGTKVSVPVSIVSAEPVNAFDLALGLNENTLSFVSMEDTQLGSSSAAFYNESDKTFRHTSFNTNNFTTNSRVAFFTFETVDGKISEKDFTSELGLLNDKKAEVKFTKSADLVNNSVDVYPNPSNGMFSVTSKVDGRVDIVDVTGKLVHPGVVVKANQMIEVNMPELSAGVYFVRMYSNNSMTTERIVISE